MMRNNKGVTLVELLIVIVVMGIIAAFAIPAVGNIIENSEKDKVVSDALAVEQGADYYCLEASCVAGTTTITWADMKPYVDGIADSDYIFDDAGTNDVVVATLASDGTWEIVLNAASGEWEWDPTTASAPTDYASAKLKRAEVTAAP